MKRVEGVRWSNLMRDTATLRTKYGADDPLDWNLSACSSPYATPSRTRMTKACCTAT